MTKVVNLWAGPGTGKSTTAAGLFFLMKTAGLRVELVTEYAKERAYEGNLHHTPQLTILDEQHRRLRRLRGKVDWIITDSPLPVGMVYCPDMEDWLAETHREAFAEWDNINIFLERTKAYQDYGRVQTEAEARLIDGAMRSLLSREGWVKHEILQACPQAPATIFKLLEKY